ncbi:MAG: chromosome partitioning protein ParA, partial [Sphingomonadales bacterium 39-62-4]
IPCRPSAFDLAAIKTTASLVKMRGKPAFVIFTAGSPTAPRMYEEAAQLVQDYGLEACPHHIADRAAFRHAAAEGKTAMEVEPNGRAADEVRELYKWACGHVNMQAFKKRRASA